MSAQFIKNKDNHNEDKMKCADRRRAVACGQAGVAIDCQQSSALENNPWPQNHRIWRIRICNHGREVPHHGHHAIMVFMVAILIMVTKVIMVAMDIMVVMVVLILIIIVLMVVMVVIVIIRTDRTTRIFQDTQDRQNRSKRGQTGQTDLPFKLDFSGITCVGQPKQFFRCFTKSGWNFAFCKRSLIFATLVIYFC